MLLLMHRIALLPHSISSDKRCESFWNIVLVSPQSFPLILICWSNPTSGKNKPAVKKQKAAVLLHPMVSAAAAVKVDGHNMLQTRAKRAWCNLPLTGLSCLENWQERIALFDKTFLNNCVNFKCEKSRCEFQSCLVMIIILLRIDQILYLICCSTT